MNVFTYFSRITYLNVYGESIERIGTYIRTVIMSETTESTVNCSDKMNGDELKKEETDQGGTVATTATGADQQNAVLKFFGGVITAAKERVLGDTWWLPNDTKEIVEIPPKYLAANHIELEHSDGFIIYKGTYTGTTLYHVAIVWKKDGKTYSIWRNNLLAASKDYIRSIAPFSVLVKYLENIKDIKMMLTKIGEHPLWQPVHIASRMDLQEFFQDAHVNGTLPILLSQTCHPEGRYPLHLSIFYNYVELTKKLFSFGASVAQPDTRGQTGLHYGARTSPAMIEVLCAHPEAKQCINALSSEGYTPLFLAVSSCRPTCVAALMNRGAVLNIRCQGRSALHEAMLQKNDTVSEVIQTLVQACPAAVTEADPLTGNSLLHTANNKKSLAALVQVSSDIEKNVKNKAGQSALHWHVQREDLGMVIALATFGLNLAAQDNDGNTALHLAVSRGNIDIVKALLVLGADVNIVNSFGDTAFHMSTRLKHKDKFDITRCLIVCGAKQCPQNKQGCSTQCAYRPPGLPPRPPPPYSTFTDVVPPSPTDTTQSAHAIPPTVPLSSSDPVLKKSKTPEKGCTPKREMSQTCGSDTIAPKTSALNAIDQFLHEKCMKNIRGLCTEMKEAQGGKKRLDTVLTLDGGGIRGLVLVQLLLALERELGGESVLKYIDWLSGTSTGALMAAALAKGKTLRECQHMYLQFKDSIFEGWVRPYSADALEKFVITLVGAQTTLADIKKPRLIVTTAAADKIPIKLHLLRNYQLPLSKEDNEKLGYKDPADLFLWKALRCSSAAPTYFCSVENKFVDGGLVANNPTMEVLSEIQRYNNALEYAGKGEEEKLRIGCVVSVGTGVMPDCPAESLNFGGMESMSAIRTLGLMLIEQACATEGSPVERSRAWLQQMGAPLFRLNPLLSKEYMLDTKEDKETIAMIWEAEEYAREKVAEFRELAEFLKMLKE